MFKLHHLTKTYNGRAVLNIDQLAIPAGELLALVGPSGAGKSTLLRLLNFLEPPTNGRLLFDGQPVTETLPLAQRRRVTTVFQRPLLLRRSVRANLAYGLTLHGKANPKAAIDHWLERLGLTHLADQAARKLSGGEAQRVALGRALLLKPDVLLLDEPTSNLDPYNVGLIENIIREVNAEQHTTIVMVTHNVFQARRLAHRTALLLQGQLVEVAETETFFTAPSDPQTAAFIRGDLVY
ncbi:MAG: ATP-binding cassette domain-containing protein [Anaerolineales bacterium]|nr:ATP-binding cassette domain-containing protein [Anaerolineales bacterium]